MLGDLRFAVRQLLKTPAFSLVALLTLALGIGVNSALFSVVSSVLLRPPGYEDPATLVDVYESSPGFRYSTTSYPNYVDVRDQNTVFSGVALYRFQTLGFARGDLAKTIWAEIVSGNYFDVLGVPALVGRTFDPGRDDVPGAAPVAVLSYGFWEREFGRDPRVIGSTVRLNGAPFEIIGVAREGFRGMLRGLLAQVWLPSAAEAMVFPGTSMLTERSNHGSFMRARLKPGVTARQAAANVLGISTRLAEIHPASNAGREFVVVPTSEVALNPAIDGMVTGASFGLLAIPGMVLLIACANLATLFLTRATARRREIAVRVALGADRGALVRQLLVESVLLALAGGALGLLLCAWLTRLAVRIQPPIPIPLALEVSVDWRVLLFTAGVSVLTGVLFGLAPALRASRGEPHADLREGARGSEGRSRFRAGLVAVQLAVSVVLLVGSGLLLRSLGGAADVDLGFRPEGAATLTFEPSQQGYRNEKAFALLEQLLARVRALPEVVAASYTSRPPLDLNVSTNEIVAEGRDPGPGRYPEIQRATVAPGYVRAIGATLTAGREFTDRDRGDPRVVMINQAAASLLWPGDDALGKRLATHSSRGPGPWREVVGIVADVKVLTIGERATPQIFYPLYESLDNSVTLIARTRGDPSAATGALREVLHELDPGMPIMSSGVLADQVATALFPVRFAAALLVVLGLAGLAIAAIGLYGIIAQEVAARSRELGIRLALGAEPGVLRRMVLIDGLKLAALGLAIGVALAALSSRVLGAWLYGVSAHDPLAFSVAPIVLLAVAALACVIPARRATRVDPVEALRSE